MEIVKISRLADITEILTSIAIVVTLVYVVIEINQNTEALNAQTRQTVLEGSQAELFELVDRPEIAVSLVKDAPLTANENIQLHMYLIANMRVREFSWLQYKSGTIDQLQWDTEFVVMKIILGTPRSRLWWSTIGRPAFSQEFATFVDDSIRNEPVTDEVWKFMQTWTTQ